MCGTSHGRADRRRPHRPPRSSSELLPRRRASLSTVEADHAGTISLAYRTADIPRPLRGYGLVIPDASRRPINAITVASRKFDWPRARRLDASCASSSAATAARKPCSSIDGDLHDVVAARAAIADRHHQSARSSTAIQRWPPGSPQYDVGHLDRIARIEAVLPEGIALIGSPYRGVGIPDMSTSPGSSPNRSRLRLRTHQP